METEHEDQRAMAFVLSASKDRLRGVEGFVMFVSEPLEREIDAVGRSVDDFLTIGQDLETDRRYPAFMTWEGSVRFTEDDVYASGKWRRSTGAEVIAAAQGRNPFLIPAPEAVVG